MGLGSVQLNSSVSEGPTQPSKFTTTLKLVYIIKQVRGMCTIFISNIIIIKMVEGSRPRVVEIQIRGPWLQQPEG